MEIPSNFNQLLLLSSESFINAITPETIEFIDLFLLSSERNPSNDTALVNHIFRVIVRLLDLFNNPKYYNQIASNELMTVPRMISSSFIFQSDTISSLIQKTLAYPQIKEQFIKSFEITFLMVENINTIIPKSFSSSKGGKSVVTKSVPTTVSSNPSLNISLNLLESTFKTFTSLFHCLNSELRMLFMKSSFINLIYKVYENLSFCLELLVKPDQSNNGPTLSNSKNQCLIDSLKSVKTSINSCLFNLFEIEFFHQQNQSDFFCDTILHLIDLCQIDNPVTYSINSPLLIDLDCEFNLINHIQNLKSISDQSNYDTSRLEYIIFLLEQVLLQSGCSQNKHEIQSFIQSRTLSSTLIPSIESDESIETSLSNLNIISIVDSTNQEEYIKRSSLISQVQDLFPDLGEGYIEALLISFYLDPEIVIQKLLDDDIPLHIRKLDRGMSRAALVPKLPDRPLSNQINGHQVGDIKMSDSIDSKPPAYDSYIGKRERTLEPINSTLKAQTIQASWQEYEDEYDDTYDSQDIDYANPIEADIDQNESKSTIKSQPKSTLSESEPMNQNEMQLVSLYNSRPHLFDIKQRKSEERIKILESLSMTDEQFEGWFKMLQRNPRKDKVLSKYEWSGNLNSQSLNVESKMDEPQNTQTGSSSRGRGSLYKKRGHLKKMGIQF